MLVRVPHANVEGLTPAARGTLYGTMAFAIIAIMYALPPCPCGSTWVVFYTTAV
jgi:hypothetical protein